MNDVSKYVFVWDVEGPLRHPAFDLAKEILVENADKLEQLGEILLDNTGVRYFDAVFKHFDNYDDERWLYDRTHDVERKHSTGTTPVISLMLCALMDMSNDDISDFVMDNAPDTPGFSEIDAMTCDINAQEFLVSNSFAPQCLTVADKKRIPYENAYCMGIQPGDDERKRYRLFDEEVEKRSPLSLWRKHKEELKEFLDSYIVNAWELYKVYKELNDGTTKNTEKLDGLLSQQEKIFNGVESEELKNSLSYFLKDETGVMGGLRKKHAIEEIKQKTGGKDILFISDSIVDVDAIEYVGETGGLSVVINCTNKHCLGSTDLSIATANWKYAEPLLRDIATGRLQNITQQNLDEYITDENRAHLKVFAGDYIKSNMDEVLSANTNTKAVLKGDTCYGLWKTDRTEYQNIWSPPYMESSPGGFQADTSQKNKVI